MKQALKKALALGTVFSLLLALSACARGTVRSTQEAPSGYYTYLSGFAGDSELHYEQDSAPCLIFHDDGTATLFLGSSILSCVCEDGRLLVNGGQTHYSFTLTGASLTLRGADAELTLRRSQHEPPTLEALQALLPQADTPVQPDTQAQTGAQPQLPTHLPDEAALAFWNSGWYGWWLIYNCTGRYAELDGCWWDLCAEILLNRDGTAVMTLWDEDLPKDDPLALCTLRYRAPDSLNPYGCLVIESGYFLSVEAPAGQWELCSQAQDIENAVSMDAGTSGDECFDFYFLMRPWGQLWDDVSEENLPYYYTDWYLPLIESGAQMPSAFVLPE